MGRPESPRSYPLLGRTCSCQGSALNVSIQKEDEERLAASALRINRGIKINTDIRGTGEERLNIYPVLQYWQNTRGWGDIEKFTVSQARWEAETASHLVNITGPSSLPGLIVTTRFTAMSITAHGWTRDCISSDEILISGSALSGSTFVLDKSFP